MTAIAIQITGSTGSTAQTNRTGDLPSSSPKINTSTRIKQNASIVGRKSRR